MNKPKSRKKINNYIIHLDEPLGEGAYAKVFVAHDDKTQTNYAVKIVERAKSIFLINLVEADEYTAKAIKLEISIHYSLVHPNIVRIYEIVQTPNNYYMFMEYCEGGSLRKVQLKTSSYLMRNPVNDFQKEMLSIV